MQTVRSGGSIQVSVLVSAWGDNRRAAKAGAGCDPWMSGGGVAALQTCSSGPECISDVRNMTG